MKPIFIALPALCLFAAACDSGQQQPTDTMEAPAPSTEAEQPRATTETPSQPDQSQAAGMETQYAEAEILPTEGQDTGGLIKFTRSGNTVRIEGTVTGLEPGAHGFHVHAKGDCSAPDASSAGGHFDPAGDPHGAPDDPPDQNHVGDLGNITAGANGEAEVNISDDEMTMSGPDSIIGKAVIVHAGKDDFTSQPSGNAGARVGCGVIHALEVTETPQTL